MILTITDKSTDKEFDIVIRRIEMIRAERREKSLPKTDAEKIEALEKRIEELEGESIWATKDNTLTDGPYYYRPSYTHTGVVPAYRK